MSKYVSQRFIENCSAQIASVEKPSQFEDSHVGGPDHTKDEDRDGDSPSEKWVNWLPKKMKDEIGKKDSINVNYEKTDKGVPTTKWGSSVNNFYPAETVDIW